MTSVARQAYCLYEKRSHYADIWLRSALRNVASRILFVVTPSGDDITPLIQKISSGANLHHYGSSGGAATEHPVAREYCCDPRWGDVTQFIQTISSGAKLRHYGSSGGAATEHPVAREYCFVTPSEVM